MNYAFYVYGSYGCAALVVGLLVLWVWLDGRNRRKELAALEANSLRRSRKVDAS
ncbi:heme exporter protein CcmD [Oryzifoliimicrobium ureilyticus]|uniref:heme exporter protein CcmD n=1 Tax=Oryzifoliimicrobium ureilyticus TaxID=3113724 RepID=UPI0030767832